MTFQITDPFQSFLDLNGNPLEAGYIFVGQPNLNAETNPKPVFWDAQFTVPALQPLRTINGRIRGQDGSPAKVFVDGSYSVLIKDKNQALVYTDTTLQESDNLRPRDQANAALLAANVDGTVGSMAGRQYIVDSTATGTDSATNDLGVDGLLPFGAVAFPDQFGCVGDGIVDDRANLIRAMNISHALGMELDGERKVYKCNSALTASAFDLRKITIDGSSVVGDVATFVGSELEAAKTLTADARQGVNSFTATAHGYAEGDIILITSTLEMESLENTRCAHWGKVKPAPGANTFSTYEQTLCNLLTADTAAAQRLPEAKAILSEINIIGGPNVVNGLVLRRFTDLQVSDVKTTDCTDRGVLVSQCFRPTVRRVTGVNSDTPGLGYGLAMAGNGFGVAEDIVGDRCRHVLTWGGVGTLPAVGGTYGNVTGFDCTGSVIDTHSDSISVKQGGGLVRGYFSAMDANQDGVTLQGVGAACKVAIEGPITRHGSLVQPGHNSAAFDVAPSFELEVSGGTPVTNGVSLDLTNCGDIDRIVIDYVGTGGVRGLLIQAGPIAVEEIVLRGFGIGGIEGLEVQMDALSDIRAINIEGEWVSGDTAQPAINILGSTDAGTRRTRVTYTGGSATGGNYGIRADNKVDVKVGAAFLEGATGATIANGGATITVLT